MLLLCVRKKLLWRAHGQRGEVKGHNLDGRCCDNPLAVLFSNVQMIWEKKALTLHVPNFMLAFWLWLQTRVFPLGLLGRKSTCLSLVDPWNPWDTSTVYGRNFWLFSFRLALFWFLQFSYFRQLYQGVTNFVHTKKKENKKNKQDTKPNHLRREK